eukprot:4871759-Prymnesium_polylepis.1
MGQTGGSGDAKYATGSISNKRGRQLRKSRRVFPRKKIVFFNTQHRPPARSSAQDRTRARGTGP